MLPAWIRVYRLFFGIIVFSALYYNLTELDDPKFWNMFTNQSNLISGIVLILGATVFAKHHNPPWWDVVRGVTVISILVTGIVFATLLGGVYNPFSTDEHTWASSVMHQLMPIVMLLDVIIAPLGPRTSKWSVIFYLIYPLSYLGWFLVSGNQNGWYPYDFINPNEYENGYLGVAITCGGLLLAFIAIGLVIIYYSRLRRAPASIQYS